MNHGLLQTQEVLHFWGGGGNLVINVKNVEKNTVNVKDIKCKCKTKCAPFKKFCHDVRMFRKDGI